MSLSVPSLVFSVPRSWAPNFVNIRLPAVFKNPPNILGLISEICLSVPPNISVHKDLGFVSLIPLLVWGSSISIKLKNINAWSITQGAIPLYPLFFSSPPPVFLLAYSSLILEDINIRSTLRNTFFIKRNASPLVITNDLRLFQLSLNNSKPLTPFIGICFIWVDSSKENCSLGPPNKTFWVMLMACFKPFQISRIISLSISR